MMRISEMPRLYNAGWDLASNLILHGHTHDGQLDWLTPTIPILSTGSAAVVQKARPEEIPQSVPDHPNLA